MNELVQKIPQHAKKNSKGILFLGLIRNTEYFYKSINLAISMREKFIIKNIYSVIWESDAINHPDEIKFLEKNDVIFIIIKDIEDQPLLEGINGSGMKVLHSISKGLEICEENQNILKTRYDVLFTKKTIESLLRTDIAYEEGLFKSKILVPAAHLSKPYFFIDWFFYSDKSTLKTITNVPIKRLIKPAEIFQSFGMNRIGFGTWQYISGFAAYSPLVEAYMMICPFFIAQKRSPRFREHMRRSLKTKSFIYLLYSYFLNINKNILIFPPKDIAFYSRWAKSKQDNIFFHGKYSKNKPNYSFYKANIFKFWPLPNNSMRDTFIYESEIFKEFPSNNLFSRLFKDALSSYHISGEKVDLLNITNQFKIDQANIINSIYKIELNKIYKVFWS